MASCQITGIPDQTWRAFRRLCLDENISANRKIRELIEAEVLAGGGPDGTAKSTELGKIESKGEDHEGQD